MVAEPRRIVEEGTSRIPHGLVPGECRAVADVLSRVGERWTMLIVHTLGDGSLRFNELRREIPGITQKVLTSTLRTLERDGFVLRTVTPTVPPRVDYELTELGRDLLVPVSAIAEWAASNYARVVAAQRDFEVRTKGSEASVAAWADRCGPDAVPRPRGGARHLLDRGE
jgi:DNA-binding HxlR family transcriptional regulator